jgi:hypothetical protein
VPYRVKEIPPSLHRGRSKAGPTFLRTTLFRIEISTKRLKALARKLGASVEFLERAPEQGEPETVAP